LKHDNHKQNFLMKKALLKFLCVGLALIIFSAQAMSFTTTATAINSDEEIAAVTGFDETEIYNAFTDVNSLVSYVQENDGVTLGDLETSHSELVSNLNSSAAIAMLHDGDSESPPIFSAFIWGCLLNWVGMLIVGLTTGFDGHQITKSAWGCLINSILVGGSYWWSYSYY
jgi:hypothetical protein